jgi:glycosyltransferase involved in cell wall biosynthesis
LKGAHEAINIALETGNRLILAGNVSVLPEEKEYFKTEIEPLIDGDKIQYVGTLDDQGKNKYLGLSKAMLFPARTEEAFGMVMVEAMACGTPVIAYGNAAIPEIIQHGVTGFVAKDYNSMKEMTNNLNALDRVLVKEHAQNSFDVKKIAQQYLNLHIH